MTISVFFPTFDAGDGIPRMSCMVCDDDIETITAEGYVDAKYVWNSFTPFDGDFIQTRYGDGTKSCLFATSVNPEGGSITLIPIAGINMS